jgi:NMD protein affecting ribosome stability and mRNA decay
MAEQSKGGQSKGASVGQKNRGRTVQEYADDTYKSRGKLPEPTACPGCHAVFHKGRWTWGDVPAKAHEETCPACHRVHDKYPAGVLTISGHFFSEHKEEILHAARNEEAQAKAEHPLRRIMGIEEKDGGVVITTTDTHLPRRIGEALHHAYHGTLHVQYAEDDKLVRVTWER